MWIENGNRIFVVGGFCVLRRSSTSFDTCFVLDQIKIESFGRCKKDNLKVKKKHFYFFNTPNGQRQREREETVEWIICWFVYTWAEQLLYNQQFRKKQHPFRLSLFILSSTLRIEHCCHSGRKSILSCWSLCRFLKQYVYTVLRSFFFIGESLFFHILLLLFLSLSFSNGCTSGHRFHNVEFVFSIFLLFRWHIRNENRKINLNICAISMQKCFESLNIIQHLSPCTPNENDFAMMKILEMVESLLSSLYWHIGRKCLFYCSWHKINTSNQQGTSSTRNVIQCENMKNIRIFWMKKKINNLNRYKDYVRSRPTSRLVNLKTTRNHLRCSKFHAIIGFTLRTSRTNSGGGCTPNVLNVLECWSTRIINIQIGLSSLNVYCCCYGPFFNSWSVHFKLERGRKNILVFYGFSMHIT